MRRFASLPIALLTRLQRQNTLRFHFGPFFQIHHLVKVLKHLLLDSGAQIFLTGA